MWIILIFAYNPQIMAIICHNLWIMAIIHRLYHNLQILEKIDVHPLGPHKTVEEILSETGFYT